MNDTTPAMKAAAKRAPARTPEQKAQDAVDAATKREERALAAEKRLNEAAKDADRVHKVACAEVDAAKAALDYAKANPDLPRPAEAPAVTSGGQVATADPSQVTS